MNGLLASIPSPSNNAITLGPLTIHLYGIVLAVAVLVAAWIAQRRWVAKGHRSDEMTDLLFWTVLAGVVGARLYHVITDYQLFTHHPVRAFEIWRGGLGIWGAVAGGALVLVLLARRRHLDVGDLIDSIAPALIIAQAIGRWGNYFNQELFGAPTTVPWALHIDPAHRPVGYAQYATFHPTFLYESIYCLLGCVALLAIEKRATLVKGQLFALYCVFYTAGRFVLEEYPNIRAALVFTRERELSVFIRMVFALQRFWFFTHRFREGLAWIHAALAAGPDEPGRATAEMLATAGGMAITLNRWEEGFDLLQRSLDRSAATGEPPCPHACSTLGVAALMQSRAGEVFRFSDEAVTVARARGDQFELADTLSQAGLNISLISDDPRGSALADEGVGIARSLGNAWLLGLTLQAAGITRYRSDPARAIVLLQEAFDISSKLSMTFSAQAGYMKAFAHLALRDEQGAAAALIRTLPALQEGGFEYFVAIALAGAALLLRRRGRRDVAVRLLAFNERLRDDGRILGAPRDLESQAQLKQRLEREIEASVFARLWAEGRAMTLDGAVTLAMEELSPIAEHDVDRLVHRRKESACCRPAPSSCRPTTT